MDVQNATARLRRTFAYPKDDNDDDDDAGAAAAAAAVALDEQEQEDLIASLAAQNAALNAQSRLFLLALPACSSLPYLIVLFRGATTATTPTPLLLAAFLGLSSLASTAWMLHALPPTATGIAALDAWISGGDDDDGDGSAAGGGMTRSTTRGTREARAGRRGGSFPLATTTTTTAASRKKRSPLEMYLPYLNVGLCAVLILTGLVTGRSATAVGGSWGAHVSLGCLPALVYAVVLVAKTVMGGVDPERELGRLRYEYKGA